MTINELPLFIRGGNRQLTFTDFVRACRVVNQERRGKGQAGIDFLELPESVQTDAK